MTSAGRIRVLVVVDEDLMRAGLRAGASGFILKRTPPEELIDGIHVIARGEALLGPSVTRRVIAAVAEGPAAPTDADRERLDALTPREREVLLLMAGGLSNSEIAAATWERARQLNATRNPRRHWTMDQASRRMMVEASAFD